MPNTLEKELSDLLAQRDALKDRVANAVSLIDEEIAALEEKRRDLLSLVKTPGGRKKRQRATIDDDEFTRLVKEKKTANELAKHFDCSTATVNNKKKALGLTQKKTKKKSK